MLSTETVKIKELENEIAELKAYIFQIKPSSVSPAIVMKNIRQECRNKHFGTWQEVMNGETTFGPNGKSYSDYSAIMDIIMKSTGLLFKYSYGKPNGGVQLQNLVNTQEDIERYRDICQMVCKDLKEKINFYTERKTPEREEARGYGERLSEGSVPEGKPGALFGDCQGDDNERKERT